MTDADSPDRVPLDRPPVPRFSPLPDLPDLPELPRNSAMMPAPTPSVPIPAPPLPAPRVSIDPPRPRPSPTPPPTLSKPAAVTVPVPTPVVASTPAPKGRWVGEALTSLVKPTKSKATVLAAAGSLVAGAFALQLIVGSGGDTASTKPTKTPEVAAVTKPAETPPTPDPEQRDESKAMTMPDIPDPKKAATGTSTRVEPLPGWGGRDTTTSPAVPPTTSGTGRIEPAPFAPAADALKMPVLPSPEVVPARFETPPPPTTTSPGVNLPTLPMPPTPPGAAPATPPPTAIPTPAPTTPAPVATPTPIPVGSPMIPVMNAPVEAPKQITPPVKPVEVATPLESPRPTEFPKPTATERIKPTPAEPIKPVVPSPSSLPEVPSPAPTPQPPAPPAPQPIAPATVPEFKFVDVPAPPKPVAPTPAAGTARTDFDVDLHPAKAGQTYEAVSKQHYADAKYADALRTFNKGRDPGRDEVQIPPVYVVRKLAGGRTPAPVAPANPIAPVSSEAWAPPATLGTAKPAAAGRSYTVPQDGLTFRDLAGTLLNDRTKYQRISDLNPTIDPNAQLRKGDAVRVP